MHQFKPGQSATGIQALANAVTIAQVLPSRTQAMVYSAGNTAHFTPAPRLTVASSAQQQQQQQLGQRQATTTPRPLVILFFISHFESKTAQNFAFQVI